MWYKTCQPKPNQNLNKCNTVKHGAQDEMDNISQTTFSNIFFFQWKGLNFDLNFTEVSFQGTNGQYPSIDSNNGFALNRRQAIIWTNDVLRCRHIYTSIGLNELNDLLFMKHILFARRGWYINL